MLETKGWRDSSGCETARDMPSRRAEPPLRPVLIILHQEHSIPGHIGNVLSAQGHPLDIRRPRFGESLPLTLAHHDGVVIFGGPMSANDSDDYIKRETDFIGVALKENKPFLGVCLGAQMMARFLGARVFLDPYGRVEIGYHDVEPGDAVYGEGPWPRRVYQWHREGFDIPDGAEVLVRSGCVFENQAFRYGRHALAIQFHPEITYAQVCRWSGRNPARLELPGAQPRADQQRDHIAHGPGVRRWLDRLLAGWVAAGREAE